MDDSALVREILTQGLSLDPEIEVIGAAADPYSARDKIIKLRPDVLTLDVEMPRMNGVEFLRRLMPQYPLPVLMVSALTLRGQTKTLECLEAGAIDFVTKPSMNIAQGLGEMLNELRQKVKTAASVDVSGWKKVRVYNRQISSDKRTGEVSNRVIGIGASTGGTEAIRAILTNLPSDLPGIVIVQHMPAGFTEMFANRLNSQCELCVREAKNGEKILRGQVLVAPGDYHLEILSSGGVFRVKLKTSEKINGHRPSVSVLFSSLAKFAGDKAMGILLTGMGSDGADGLLNMKKAGAKTLAQDEESSVVFGMPRVAFKLGSVEKLTPLDEVSAEIINYARELN